MLQTQKQIADEIHVMVCLFARIDNATHIPTEELARWVTDLQLIVPQNIGLYDRLIVMLSLAKAGDYKGVASQARQSLGTGDYELYWVRKE